MKIKKESLVNTGMVNIDPIGIVYHYEGKIIRIINRNAVRHVRKLFDIGLVQQLIEKKLLVDTWISDLTDEEGGLVLEHKKIEPNSNASQWSFEMMKSVAIMVLKLNKILIQYGYELKDCHAANVLFDGANPVYIDFGSIIKQRNSLQWTMKDEFLQSYYYPLMLWSRGYVFTVSALLKSTKNLDELRRIYYYGLPQNLINACELVSSYCKKKNVEKQMELYITRIQKLDCMQKTYWGEYQNEYWGKQPGKRLLFEIDWIKSKEDIASMVEIGANQGYFAYRVATMTNIRRIIATDYDMQAVNSMYKKLIIYKDAKDIITPLILDFIWAPIKVLENCKCDLIVANAITHHLILTQKMNIKLLVERLASMTNKYVIVEFMPYGVGGSTPKWYNLEWFLENLQSKFKIIEVNNIEKKRIVVIGEKVN